MSASPTTMKLALFVWTISDAVGVITVAVIAVAALIIWVAEKMGF